MAEGTSPLTRCGIDTVEIVRVERLLRGTPHALGLIGLADFALARDGYGAPRVVCSPRALALIARYRLKPIAVSLAHDKTSASAVAVAEPAPT
jgi:hypothetical protein